ncbi:hypothetical protein SAMN05216409_10397 [Pseudomonas lutea]|uniref:Uncharacterized protein n=1 Tax=Pseudomonas lutea TaxID=243924 RepID=A0A9X8QI89_9PSED|nr:hypothetical protein SAMN05216409_10397 [Pseudomonas lutea]
MTNGLMFMGKLVSDCLLSAGKRAYNRRICK